MFHRRWHLNSTKSFGTQIALAFICNIFPTPFKKMYCHMPISLALGLGVRGSLSSWGWKNTHNFMTFMPRPSTSPKIFWAAPNFFGRSSDEHMSAREFSHGLNQRENTLRDSLQKVITLHKARSLISLRLVQNACKNWAIGLGLTPWGPKYAQEP